MVNIDTESGMTDEGWDILLREIKKGKCTPILGAGACADVLPTGSEIARKWAEEYNYPFQDSYDLARVSQFLSVNRHGLFPKEEIKEHFRGRNPDYEEYDEPHAVLAQLPLPLYITTNYDNYMMEALRRAEDEPNIKKEPQVVLCLWNKVLRENLEPSRFPGGRKVLAHKIEPNSKKPIVFHMHGHIDTEESLVLTEDDYLEFLMNVSNDSYKNVEKQDEMSIPMRIRRAFATTSLLIMGYNLADWDFRVLFHSINRYFPSNVRRFYVVQLEPEVQGKGDASQVNPDGSRVKEEERMQYLKRYYERLGFNIYFGTCRDFARELHERWQAFNGD